MLEAYQCEEKVSLQFWSVCSAGRGRAYAYLDVAATLERCSRFADFSKACFSEQFSEYSQCSLLVYAGGLIRAIAPWLYSFASDCRVTSQRFAANCKPSPPTSYRIAHLSLCCRPEVHKLRPVIASAKPQQRLLIYRAGSKSRSKTARQPRSGRTSVDKLLVCFLFYVVCVTQLRPFLQICRLDILCWRAFPGDGLRMSSQHVRYLAESHYASSHMDSTV